MKELFLLLQLKRVFNLVEFKFKKDDYVEWTSNPNNRECYRTGKIFESFPPNTNVKPRLSALLKPQGKSFYSSTNSSENSYIVVCIGKRDAEQNLPPRIYWVEESKLEIQNVTEPKMDEAGNI